MQDFWSTGIQASRGAELRPDFWEAPGLPAGGSSREIKAEDTALGVAGDIPSGPEPGQPPGLSHARMPGPSLFPTPHSRQVM